MITKLATAAALALIVGAGPVAAASYSYSTSPGPRHHSTMRTHVRVAPMTSGTYYGGGANLGIGGGFSNENAFDRGRCVQAKNSDPLMVKVYCPPNEWLPGW